MFITAIDFLVGRASIGVMSIHSFCNSWHSRLKPRLYLALGDSHSETIVLRMVHEMCTSCALALDGVDDGEIRISLGTWHGYACAGSTSSQVQVGTCEVAFVIGVITRLGRYESIFSLVRWYHTYGGDDAGTTTLLSYTQRMRPLQQWSAQMNKCKLIAYNT